MTPTRRTDRALRIKSNTVGRPNFMARRHAKAMSRRSETNEQRKARIEAEALARYERMSREAKQAREAYEAEVARMAAIEADAKREQEQYLLNLKPSYEPLLSEMRARMAQLVHPDDAAQDAHVRQVLYAG